jgi:hypothetical protein
MHSAMWNTIILVLHKQTSRQMQDFVELRPIRDELFHLGMCKIIFVNANWHNLSQYRTIGWQGAKRSGKHRGAGVAAWPLHLVSLPRAVR